MDLTTRFSSISGIKRASKLELIRVLEALSLPKLKDVDLTRLLRPEMIEYILAEYNRQLEAKLPLEVDLDELKAIILLQKRRMKAQKKLAA